MKESCNRWKANGLPRKGWLLKDVIDHEEVCRECEWCGTSIRYEHILERQDSPIITSAGCICAENLTEDYVNPRARENELRKKAQAKLNEKKRKLKLEQKMRQIFYNQFKKSKKGNLYRKSQDSLVTILCLKNGYKLVINNIYGKKVFSLPSEAACAAYEYLYGKYL